MLFLEEVRSGGLGGELYAQSLATTLAVHVLRGHSSIGDRDRKELARRPGGLSPRALQRALDYVGDHLSGDLSLEEVARAAHLSPRHFSPLCLASAVDFATAPFLSAAYVASIVLLYEAPAWRRVFEPLAPVGRMALSNYLLQSLVAAFLFTGYGLGLYGKVGAAAGLGLSLVIFAAQIPLSSWWLSRFDFGPSEWVLRSFTYGRLQPLRSNARVGGPKSTTAPPHSDAP